MSSDKPLPSPPVLTLAHESSPLRKGRSLLDASERPLYVSMGASAGRAWPVLSPERKLSQNEPVSRFSSSTTSTSLPKDSSGESSSKDRETSVVYATEFASSLNTTSSMSEGAASVDKRVSWAPHSFGQQNGQETGQNTKAQSLARPSSFGNYTAGGNIVTSSTAAPKAKGFIDFAHNHALPLVEERTHSPSPVSFSRPRPNKTADSISKHGKGPALASRIPYYDPKTSPEIVNIRKASISSTEESPKVAPLADVPTFGGRRLDNPEDFAALCQDTPRRRGTEQNASAAHSTHGISVQDFETSVGAPEDYSSSDQASAQSVRIHRASSQILPGLASSTTHQADYLLATQEADSRSSSGRSSTVQMPTALSEVASPTAPYKIPRLSRLSPEISWASLAVRETDRSDKDGNHRTLYDGASAVGTDDPQVSPLHVEEASNPHIQATLSMLEGGHDNPANKVQVINSSKDHRQCVALQDENVFHPADRGHEQKLRAKVSEQDMVRSTTTTLPRYSERTFPSQQTTFMPQGVQGQSSMQITRGPSQTTQRTPSSVRRDLLAPGFAARPPTTSSRDGSPGMKSIGYPSRVTSKASAIIGPNDSAQRSLTGSVGKRTPNAPIKGMTALPTPSSMSSQRYQKPAPVITAKSSRTDFRLSRATTEKVQTTPRSRSKSRIVMDNIKGLFTGKREDHVEQPPPMPSVGGENAGDSRGRKVTAAGSPVGKTGTLPRSHACPDLNAAKDKEILDSEPLQGTSALTPETKSITDAVNRAFLEAQKEPDLVAREKMLSIASVMLDALSSSRQAEKSMLEAQQAAAAAKASYELTQRSMQEMGRLINSKGHGVPALFRKLGSKSAH